MHVMRRIVGPVALVALVACGSGEVGGGEALTADAYFAQVDAIGERTDEAFADWEHRFGQALAEADSPADAAAAAEPLLEEATALVRDMVGDLDALMPPEELQEAHAAFLRANRDALAAFQDLVDHYDELGFDRAMQDLEDDAFQELDDRMDATCSDLQQLANERSIEVDLACDRGATA